MFGNLYSNCWLSLFIDTTFYGLAFCLRYNYHFHMDTYVGIYGFKVTVVYRYHREERSLKTRRV